MAIEFHCNYCGKMVRAPEEAGGKKGKCPSCEHVLYVPMPDDQVEELDLAPIDEDEERRKRRMEEQALQAERALLHDREPPSGDAAQGPVNEAPLPPTPPPLAESEAPASAEDIEFLITDWVRSMADGDLGDADRTMLQLRKNKEMARQKVDQIAMADPPSSSLQDVPRPVLNRYFKMLRQQL